MLWYFLQSAEVGAKQKAGAGPAEIEEGHTRRVPALPEKAHALPENDEVVVCQSAAGARDVPRGPARGAGSGSFIAGSVIAGGGIAGGGPGIECPVERLLPLPRQFDIPGRVQ